MSEAVFYSEGHPESNVVDGHVYHLDGADPISWADLIDKPGDGASDSTSPLQLVNIQSHFNQNNMWVGLYRTIILFNLASWPEGMIPISGIVTFNGSAKGDTPGWEPDVNIYSASPNSDTALVAGDFDSLGSTAYCDSPISYDDWAIGTTGEDPAPNNFTLNTTGMSALNTCLAGDKILRIGVRNACYDVAESSPTWAASSNSYIYAYSTEQSGTNYDPYITITYKKPALWLTIF